MRPGVKSTPSTHPHSAATKSCATTAEATAMESTSSETTATTVKAATAAAKTSSAVPSTARPCRSCVISRDEKQRAKSQRKERDEFRPADRHGTLSYTDNGSRTYGSDSAKPESIHYAINCSRPGVPNLRTTTLRAFKTSASLYVRTGCLSRAVQYGSACPAARKNRACC